MKQEKWYNFFLDFSQKKVENTKMYTKIYNLLATSQIASGHCLFQGCDVVESLNAILKRPYNDHTASGGGGVLGATTLQRDGGVVLQAWEWWAASYCPVCHGQTHGHPKPRALHILFAIPALVSPPHGPRNVEVPLWGPSTSPRRPIGMLALLVFMSLCELILRQSCLIFVG